MKIGVVGCGLVWQYEHQPILLKMQNELPIVAFCAPEKDQEMLDKASQAFPDAAMYHDYCDLIADNNVEAVLIATPIQVLEPVALAAIEAGKHIFIEKPVALTAAGVEKIQEAAEAKGILAYVLEQSWYDDCAVQAKKYMDNGELGRILSFDFISHSIIGENLNERVPYGKTEWRRNPPYAIGTIMDRGVHDLATISFLFGFPVAICAFGVQTRETFGKYDRVTVLMEYPDGVSATFSHAGVIEGSSNGMHIWGTKGTVALLSDGLALSGVTFTDNQGNVTDLPITSETRRQCMWREISAYAAQGKSAPAGIRQMANILKTIECIGESIETRKIICLDAFER